MWRDQTSIQKQNVFDATMSETQEKKHCIENRCRFSCEGSHLSSNKDWAAELILS